MYGTSGADIGAEEVFQNPPDNTYAVVVAIIDTGVDMDHPDLAESIWSNPGEIPYNGLDDDHNGYVDDVNGWDFCNDNVTTLPPAEDNDPTDTHGHGTHCSGIVAAVINNSHGVAGVVPKARIMPLKFFPIASAATASRAIVYAADNGADVINMSWGMCAGNMLVHEAVAYARSRGVVLVASAGNHGEEMYSPPSYYPDVISVSASNSDDQITSWSTYSDSVDVCAPGQSILSLRADTTDMYFEGCGGGEPLVHIIDEHYYLASGTSMSSPYVAAVAAYLRSVSPGLSADVTKEIIESTADDIVDPYGLGENLSGWDPYSGHGRINLPAALAVAPRVAAIIDAPDNDIVSGTIDIKGTAGGEEFTDYVLEYGAGDNPTAWSMIASSGLPVAEGTLGSWNTTGLEGYYTIRLRVGTVNTATTRVFVTDRAIAQIDWPNDSDKVSGYTTISGTALCPDFLYGVLEYGVGIAPSSWNGIDIVATPIFQGALGDWVTTILTTGTYTLRLSVYSHSGLEVADSATVFTESVFTSENGWVVDFGERLCRSANYCDIDRDGENEIIIGTETGIKVVNTDGTIQTTGIPPFPTDSIVIPVAVGRLDDDEYDDLVALGWSGTLYGYPSQAPSFEVTLSQPPTGTGLWFSCGTTGARLFLRDIDNDGIDEIHYYPGNNIDMARYYYMYHADGTPWEYDFTELDQQSFCQPADLDGDGFDELYCYRWMPESGLMQLDWQGNVIAFRKMKWDGEEIETVGSVTVADVDVDGKLELIVNYTFMGTSGIYDVGLSDWKAVYDENLILKEGWPRELVYESWCCAPVFCDLNNDGVNEMVGVAPSPDHGQPEFYAWNIDGTPFLEGGPASGLIAVVPQPGKASTPIVADMNNDGLADIMTFIKKDSWYNFKLERVAGYSSNGEMLDGFPLGLEDDPHWGQPMAPLVGDINQDGFVDMVCPSNNGKLSFVNFPGIWYRPRLSFCPMWNYNRRLNGIPPMLLSPSAECVGLTGNVDCDPEDAVDLGDLTTMIDYLFISMMPLCSPEEANCDGSPDGIVDLGDLTRLIDYLFISYAPLAECQ